MIRVAASPRRRRRARRRDDDGRHARAVAADTATTTAVIVIDTGSSVRAITVDVGSGMSGLAALQRVANVTTLAFAGNGGAVCAIDGVGNDATQSACLVGPNSQYWAYFHSSGGAGAWSYSPVGAGSFTVHGGDVDGWRYGTGAEAGCVAGVLRLRDVRPACDDDIAERRNGQHRCPARRAGARAPRRREAGQPGRAVPVPAPVPRHPGPAATATRRRSIRRRRRRPRCRAADRADPTSTRRNGSGVRVEAAAAGTGGGPDSGSPVGVAIAAGILVIAAASAVWLRRRSRVPG